MKVNKNIFKVILIFLVASLVYVLGFANNVSYASSDFTDVKELVDFNTLIQGFNNLLFYSLIVLFLILLSCYIAGNGSRAKYKLSNVITTYVMSAGLLAFSLLNFVKLPGFIKTYSDIIVKYPEEIARLQRISSLSPTNTMYYLGLGISVIFTIISIYLVVFINLKMKNQKNYIIQRDEVLKNAV